MTDTDTVTAVDFTDEQKIRGKALLVAKSVLTGSPALFGGTTNGRGTDELIAIADYIVGAPIDVHPPTDEPEACDCDVATIDNLEGKIRVLHIVPVTPRESFDGLLAAAARDAEEREAAGKPCPIRHARGSK